MSRSKDETFREAEQPDDVGPRKARLHVMGPGRFETIALPENGSWVIGRSDECDLILDAKSVSRRHAALEIAGGFRIEDLGSANGTVVRGHRLTARAPTAILPKDAIEIGAFTLTISLDEQVEREPKIWPHGYFEACLDAECKRAKAIDVLRIQVDDAPDPRAIVRALTVDLSRDEIAAEQGPRDFEILFIDRKTEVVSVLTQSLLSRLEKLGSHVAGVGAARFPEDGATAGELLQSVSHALSTPKLPIERKTSIVVEDEAMHRLYKLIDRVAPGSINVLIRGETGVGKEIIAETIHRRSRRSEGPFVRLNCAALPESLFESELFGHEKGAFTGAAQAKPGLLETAGGGTLFLDEIAELPMGVQVKLLRVLEERQVLRLGSLAATPIDCRLVCATHRPVEADIESGRFRQDLYYRLNGITIRVPPLRERRAEIEGLANVFIRQACARDQRSVVPRLSPTALEQLLAYAWPGNIRELKNVVERAVLLAEGQRIEPTQLIIEGEQDDPDGDGQPSEPDASEHLPDRVQAFEREQIVRVLQACGGNQTLAAKQLGIARRTLINRLEAYGIDRPRKKR
jgi:DNA-binding NtrC family response regulator